MKKLTLATTLLLAGAVGQAHGQAGGAAFDDVATVALLTTYNHNCPSTTASRNELAGLIEFISTVKSIDHAVLERVIVLQLMKVSDMGLSNWCALEKPTVEGAMNIMMTGSPTK